MLEAHGGHGDFPRVRTFRQLDSSTNNVFDDLKEAERWTGIQGKVDMAELTWEQRERILRMMFAKMNGFKEKRRYGRVDSVNSALHRYRRGHWVPLRPFKPENCHAFFEFTNFQVVNKTAVVFHVFKSFISGSNIWFHIQYITLISSSSTRLVRTHKMASSRLA